MNKPIATKQKIMKKKISSVHESTAYQLHKSQLSIFTGIMHKVIDFTEYKLKQYAQSIDDQQQKTTLIELIAKYKKGQVAVAWREGRPIWLAVTKEILHIHRAII